MSGIQNTEDSILSNIPDFAEDTSGTAEGGSTTQGAEDTGGEGRSSAQPTQTGRESSGTDSVEANQPPIRRRHDGLLERANPDNPKVRDLVDPVSGKIVAQGGIERRVYEESQRIGRENNALKQRIQGYENVIRQSNEVVQEAARLGVDPENAKIAVRVMADFVRDPVRTLQSLVEEVKAKGYQIPFLAEGVSPGMDMNAFSRMIDAKLAPIMGRHTQEQAQVQARQRAEAELEAFLQDNQEANQNLDVLGEMLQAQPGLSLQTAYTKMIRWSHENGLDWTQPLKQQIAALRQQQSSQPTNQQTETRPLPGRGARGNAQRMNGADSGGRQFNENASWADIIRSAMEESGGRLQ